MLWTIRGVLPMGEEDRPDGDAHEDEDRRDPDHREPEFGLNSCLILPNMLRDGTQEAQCDEGDHPLRDHLNMFQ